MPFLSLSGVDLHYRTQGAGPTLVLVHGLGSSGADWAFQATALAEHFHVVMPDLRGSGRSAAAAGPESIAQLADDLWQLLDHLGVTRTHLLGFSLGGAVVTEMALQRPDMVLRLMTINSLPSYRVDTWRKWLEVYGQMTLVQVLGLRRTAGMVARRMFPYPHQAAMRERVVGVLGPASKRGYLRTARILTGWCALDRIECLRMPMLMLAAEQDYTPMHEKHEFARRLGAQLVTVSGSRHGTPFDAIGATNATALAFFRDMALPTRERLCIDAADQVPAVPPLEFDPA